jgi:hypothetical protein
MGWGDVRYCIAMSILVIILILLPHICFAIPLFVSMATAAKFVQPIPAYLVPLDVEVVPIKCHQFLFGE